MKPLRRILDRIHPLFAKGGKYERFYPLYEAADTFLYTPGTVTKHASHVRDGMDMKRIMIMVCIALIPCVYMAFWNTGYQANIVIHNRKLAEQMVGAGVIPASEIGTVLQSSIGRPLEDNVDAITRGLAKKRGREYLATADVQRTIEARVSDGNGEERAQVERELLSAYTSDISPGLRQSISESLATSDASEDVELSAIGYEPGWRGRLLQSLGLSFDPGSFWSNVILGGLYFLPVYIVCMVVGGLWEALFAVVRGHEINEGFLVTGLLFPLTLPPTIPLWQVALGISFGVVIGKEIFGGTGRNFLNPALTARAFLYFAYPAQSTGEGIWTAVNVDGFSGATSLGVMAVADVREGLAAMDVSWWQAFLGTTPGSMGETSELACLIGAAILIAAGIASWRIMAGMLLGGLAFSALLWGIGSQTNPMFAVTPWHHLVIGSFMFGLVYMATDPVSASMTQAGKWWFGGLIGVMTILVRVINPAFPEGVMLAILFGNVLAPLIDYFVVQANIKRRLARDAA
jgi:Na+-transporting NADH:ubiquinone oxidoreductase subunit B